MAQTEPPSLQPPSRRERRHQPTLVEPELPSSRAARTRARRERSIERRFTALFVLAVAALVLYLMLESRWGTNLIHHWHP
ncbi:hypothetical protein [Sulfobacillus harzensis]|uniref:Uncharacterized protein n=1 Tax=Sulfobacillus harzensis TaxID=2729629 RepID=A0A7Y0Q371_9FIRM|nr:hypothetical protein [Sulfobacillus harzensis]NMP22666.1 hypothetical protein [Sulfobacillus harzensis]